jgi:hypothetical protein
VLWAALLFGAFIGAGWLVLTLDPKVLARALRIAALVGLGLVALFLAARGAAVLDLPLGALILYLLHHWSARGFPGAGRVKDWLAGKPASAGMSTVETPFLRMTLDQSTGALGGEVIAGRFAGATLDRLGPAQLQELLAECAASDNQSVRLLETYLDRTHPGWREQTSGHRPARAPRCHRDAAGAPQSRLASVAASRPGPCPFPRPSLRRSWRRSPSGRARW